MATLSSRPAAGPVRRGSPTAGQHCAGMRLREGGSEQDWCVCKGRGGAAAYAEEPPVCVFGAPERGSGGRGAQ